MGSCSLLLCMLGLTIVIVGDVVYGQDSIQDLLNAHNSARSAVGVPNLVWDDVVASYAERYANERRDCQLIHSSGGPYGENIAMGWGGYIVSGTDAVRLWVNEKPYYDYNFNTCVGGVDCLHYTQIVWRNSLRVGCAKVTCNNGGVFVTCNYDPPGNIIGERPY
ncbi:hypothetical protein HN51_030540 [Arachis hypogaea]|uniref:Pathogenesis-related protein 1C-like n=1 Tax=Arachis duranensis TaxID=130453 RepID=A0A6P4BNX6_ARADU|nr:pathogenesis-related protein 1C-like [Arachis duranensis]XP_025622196.1 pathogenesis-related protein 1C [Arachis hypogaea]